MSDALYRLRGALVLGTIWGALFAIVGIVLALVIGVVLPQEIDAGEGPLSAGLVLGVAGFLSGMGFSALLSWSERGRRLHDLSLGRVALYGALGAAAIPSLLGADPGEGWITGAVGGILAAGSVALARRGVPGGRPPNGSVEHKAEARSLPHAGSPT